VNLQNDRAKLDWTVLCDQEIDQFVIERSIDGIHFTDVSTVTGRSIIHSAESYTTIDDVSTINSEIIYYRLRTVAKDGKTKTGSIVSVRRVAKSNITVQLLPNPVKDRLEVLLNATIQSAAQLYILDANGRVVQKYSENVLQGSNSFVYSQAGNLPVGVYYLRVNIGNKIITQKFSVVK
jgi:hypothetical protein